MKTINKARVIIALAAVVLTQSAAQAQYPFNSQNSWGQPGQNYWNNQQRQNHLQQLEMQRHMEWQEAQRRQQELNRMNEQRRQNSNQRNCTSYGFCY